MAGAYDRLMEGRPTDADREWLSWLYGEYLNRIAPIAPHPQECEHVPVAVGGIKGMRERGNNRTFCRKCNRVLRLTWDNKFVPDAPQAASGGEDVGDLLKERIENLIANHIQPSPAPATEVRPVNGKGRGVIAARDISAGEIIETAPVIPFRPGQPMPEELADMPFDWVDGRKCLVLGNCQLLNHADDPNAVFDYKDDSIVFTARKHIKAGEEITFHYGVPLWFTPTNSRGVPKIPLGPGTRHGSGGGETYIPPATEDLDGLIERLRGDTQMSDRPWAVELMLEAADALDGMRRKEEKTYQQQCEAEQEASELTAALTAAQSELSTLKGKIEGFIHQLFR